MGERSELDAAIAQMEEELRLLRGAREILRRRDSKMRLESVSDSVARSSIALVATTPGEFSGKKMEDVAEMILREHPQGLTSHEVTEIAIKRGYQSTSSRNPNNDPKTIRMSFHVTMQRRFDKFEKTDDN